MSLELSMICSRLDDDYCGALTFDFPFFIFILSGGELSWQKIAQDRERNKGQVVGR